MHSDVVCASGCVQWVCQLYGVLSLHHTFPVAIPGARGTANSLPSPSDVDILQPLLTGHCAGG